MQKKKTTIQGSHVSEARNMKKSYSKNPATRIADVNLNNGATFLGNKYKDSRKCILEDQIYILMQRSNGQELINEEVYVC